ncbi:uncharacterized protein LOC120154479 [Hibiscus syriacus]|uniref:uncharacterized protein LOC120154479 n=1 Tax=Hibiscus syriacus TaxID=106335 RepID=UPI001922EB93|nr:uncharacterized protein LOC120154479 [Hibiscus syriacus]
MKKGEDSMRVYLTRIKEICDSLASCGSLVSQVEHVVSILKGLPREYQPFMAIITITRETLSLDQICSMLVDAETQIAGFDAQPEDLPMSAHIAQGRVAAGSSEAPRAGRSNRRGRGRTRIQCPLCGRNGHFVDRCWYRFDRDFPGVNANSSSTRATNAFNMLIVQHSTHQDARVAILSSSPLRGTSNNWSLYARVQATTGLSTRSNESSHAHVDGADSSIPSEGDPTP